MCRSRSGNYMPGPREIAVAAAAVPAGVRSLAGSAAAGARSLAGSAAAAAAVAAAVAAPGVGEHISFGVPVNVPAHTNANSHGRGPGQPSVPTTPCASVNLTLFQLNSRGLRCPPENLAKVDALLRSLDLLDFVAITETWLDRGTEYCSLSGYHVVSRLDRRGAGRTDRGGIVFFVREGLQDSVVHI